MKQTYKVFKVGKQAVSGVLEAGQMRSIGLAAGLVALVGLSATQLQAQAVTEWVDWNAPSTDVNDPAYFAPTAPGGYDSNTERATSIAGTTYIMGASGSLSNSTVVMLEGEVMSESCFDNSTCNAWNGFGSQDIGSANVSTIIGSGTSLISNNKDMISHTGFVSGTDTTLHSLTFEDSAGNSVSQNNVVMAIFSLGDPDSLAELLFTNDFEIVSYSSVTGATSGAVRTATTSGYKLSGYETDAYIRFLDPNISTITWQVAQPEFWFGFNVGVSNTTVSGPAAGTPFSVAALPSMQSVVGRDITASNDIHADLGNSSPTNAQLNYVFDGGTLIVGADLTDAFTIKSGGGTVSIASGDTYTMSGVISNATGATGSLTKTGAGVLTLTGTNTYTGGTTVSAGTLEASGSSIAQSSGLEVASGATFDAGAPSGGYTFVKSLSGAGSVLLDTNKHLKVTNGVSSDVFSGVVSGGAGTGGLEVGGGTLTLSGANTYTGGTTVSGGTLSVAADAALGAVAGNVTLNGGTLATTANMSSARAVSLGASNGTVDTAAATTLTLSGVVSNATGATGSLTKTGAGVLTLTGTNTYTGGTTVSAGTLDLDRSLTSDVAVASTGRIEGVGSTSGDLTSDGTVAPGNSPGTLTVAGDVVFTSGNTFITELDGLTYSAAGGAGTYDRLAVTGTTATFTAAGAITPILRGISAPANNTLDPVIGDAFRVVTTANVSGVSGAFSTVTDPTSGMPTNTRFDVLYGGNYVDLVLTPDDLSTFAAAYGIQNMVNAADAFDGIRPAQGTNGATDKDKFFNGLYGLTAQETAVALLQASGEVHAFALSDARDAWSDGLGTVRSSSQGAGDYYWVDMSGYNLAVDEDTIASAYDSKTRKFWIGSDVYQDRSTTYGFALGVSESELSMANSGSADTTTYSLAAYMRGAQGAFEYDGLVSLNRSNIDTNRSVSLSTGSLSNTSSSDVRGLAMSAQLGYRYDVAPSLVSGLAWIKGDLDNTRTDTFTEDGSTVTALTVNGYEVKSAKVSVGYTLSGKIPNSGVEAGLWSFGVGAAKDVSRGMPDVSRTMSLHGASWSVSVPKAGDVTKFVSGGIAIPLGNDAVAELSLSAAKRDGALSKSAAFGFSVKW